MSKVVESKLIIPKNFLIDFICYNHVLFSDETGRFSIVGYDCFFLKPENYSMIELCFFSAETAFPSPQALLLSDNRIVSVGELSVIDFTDSSNPMSCNVVLLEWDLNCILMKESPPLRKLKVSRTKVRFVMIPLFGINTDNTA